MEFESFVESSGPRLRAALVASYGQDVGLDAAAEALAYAWEHWDRLAAMANPSGYAFRVGQTAARRTFRIKAELPVPAHHELPEFEPGLIPALAGLSESQRTSVLLVHGFGWKQVEVAELLDVDPATVRKHISRGLKKLQDALEVESHV